jgi:hypothetical protein
MRFLIADFEIGGFPGGDVRLPITADADSKRRYHQQKNDNQNQYFFLYFHKSTVSIQDT